MLQKFSIYFQIIGSCKKIFSKILPEKMVDIEYIVKYRE